METINNRPLIDYISFLQMIYNMTKAKEHPTESEKRLILEVEDELCKYIQITKK
jgi:hypothetical protein